MNKSFEERTEETIERSIYILRCEDDFYYIGESKTKWLEMRIRQQFGEKIKKGGPSKFCEKHKPIEIVSTFDLGILTYKEAEIIENAWTKIFVNRFGKDKVRGGISCLGEDEKKEISSDTKEEILGLCDINGLD